MKTDSTLASGWATVPYSDVTLSAVGGEGEYTWSLADGSSLPSGMSLSADGVISGTPAKSGSYSFSVTVTDEAGKYSSKTFSLTVYAGIKPSNFVGTFDTGMVWDAWSIGGYWAVTNEYATRDELKVSGSPYAGGTNALLVSVANKRSGTITTPMIDFSSATNATLYFWLRKTDYSTSTDKLYIEYKTNYSDSAKTLLTVSTNVSDWAQFSVELPNLTETYFIQFRGTTQGSIGLDEITLDAAVTNTELTVYQQWKQDWFGDSEYDDDADDDGDGLTTLEEFLLGADPTSDADGGAWQLDIYIEDEKEYVVAREGADARDYGVVFIIEACTNLTDSSWSTNGVFIYNETLTNDWYRVIYSSEEADTSTVPQRFYRRRYTWPE